MDTGLHKFDVAFLVHEELQRKFCALQGELREQQEKSRSLEQKLKRTNQIFQQYKRLKHKFRSMNAELSYCKAQYTLMSGSCIRYRQISEKSLPFLQSFNSVKAHIARTGALLQNCTEVEYRCMVRCHQATCIECEQGKSSLLDFCIRMESILVRSSRADGGKIEFDIGRIKELRAICEDWSTEGLVEDLAIALSEPNVSYTSTECVSQLSVVDSSESSTSSSSE